MDESSARGERLRKARTQAQLSVSQVARRSGYSESGVRAIENGQNGLRPDAAERFAPILGVSAAWLLTGRGGEAAEPMIRVVGRAGADTSGELIHSDADADYDHVPAPPHGIPANAAIEVFGESMRAIAEDGALIYFNDQRTPPTPDMIGYPCVVELEDGRVLFKRLLRGSREGVYMLESNVGPPIDDVRIRWAAEPTLIVPAKVARRIIIKAGHRQVA